jgi:RNA polymerase sigma factor (sigma-70 family)
MTPILEMLCSHSFREMFQDLGWDRAATEAFVGIGERNLIFHVVAQKRGLAVLHCNTDRVNLADRTFLRNAQRLLSRSFHEHIAVYASEEPRKQVWQWAVRLPDGRKVRHREHPFFSAAPAPGLVLRLEKLRFSLEEEENATILDALDRVRLALDVDAEMSLFTRWPGYARRSDLLARRMQAGDPTAFHEFILLHRPLARSIARRLERWFGMDPDDAEQMAVIGLIMAARKFKPELGYQFSTYATHWVRQACQRLGPDFALSIRIPQYVFWPCFRLRRQLERMVERQAPEEAWDEVVAQIESDDVLSKHWREFMTATSVQSLPQYSALVDPASTPVELCIRSEENATLRTMIGRLHRRQAQIIRMRFGIDGPPHTLEAIGQQLGLTRERVRQIQNRALARLQEIMKSESRVAHSDDSDLPRKG